MRDGQRLSEPLLPARAAARESFVLGPELDEIDERCVRGVIIGDGRAIIDGEQRADLLQGFDHHPGFARGQYHCGLAGPGAPQM